MGKRSRRIKGKDKFVPLIPAVRATVGDKVWWQRTWYNEGEPTGRMWYGIVEVRRGNMCVIRDRYNHEHVVGVGMLFKPET
jgi:hypothetical protein